MKRVGVNKDVEVDLNLCALLAEQHAKNYYAWVHRLWTVRWARPPGILYAYCIHVNVYAYVCDLLSTGSHKCTSGIGGSSRLGSGNSSYSYSSVVFVVDLKVVVVV